MKFEHLLVASDGSEIALKAAAAAGSLARALRARVSALYVHDEEIIVSHAWGLGTAPAGPAPGVLSVDQIREMLEQRANESEIPKTVKAIGETNGKVESIVVWGRPADEICRFAKKNDVDMIVIGSHGRSGFKEALLGSVSHAVANQASCPVTIVR